MSTEQFLVITGKRSAQRFSSGNNQSDYDRKPIRKLCLDVISLRNSYLGSTLMLDSLFKRPVKAWHSKRPPSWKYCAALSRLDEPLKLCPAKVRIRVESTVHWMRPSPSNINICLSLQNFCFINAVKIRLPHGVLLWNQNLVQPSTADTFVQVKNTVQAADFLVDDTILCPLKQICDTSGIPIVC